MDAECKRKPSVQPHRTSRLTSTTHRTTFTKSRQHCIAQDESDVTLLYKQQLISTLSMSIWLLNKNSVCKRKRLKGKIQKECINEWKMATNRRHYSSFEKPVSCILQRNSVFRNSRTNKQHNQNHERKKTLPKFENVQWDKDGSVNKLSASVTTWVCLTSSQPQQQPEFAWQATKLAFWGKINLSYIGESSPYLEQTEDKL